ncbi:caspase-3-like [Ylistrum balloti]|uniref:caspase-3-like n=1 Tax=Ylistrum balloti TaxID=509963 RepID=UPI002905BAC9|nr:caspase-3-like [Ylistrum balloti]
MQESRESIDTEPIPPTGGDPLPQPETLYDRNENEDQAEPVIQGPDLYAAEYKTYPEPGHAVIINNRKFTDLPDREGTDKDAANLLNRFNEFGFHTRLICDKSRHELLEELKNIARMDHTEHSTFFCTFLTHGNERGIWATDSQIKMNELSDIFDAKNCPTLINKPKIFLMQACRGNDDVHAATIRVLNPQAEHVAADTMPDEPEEMEVQEVEEPASIDILTVPTIMDFLFIYSTVEGKKAYRNTAMGTPFIAKFCEELEFLLHNKGEDDIYTLLNRVNLSVAIKFQAHDGGKQMPCFVSTLTKTFKLKAPQ